MAVDELERARELVAEAERVEREESRRRAAMRQEGRALVDFLLGRRVFWRHPHGLYFYEDDDCGSPPTMYMTLRCACQRQSDYRFAGSHIWQYRLSDGDTLADVLAAVGEHAETGR